jgi:bacterioferritin (cytochrome b1)
MATDTEEILEYAAKQFGSQPQEAAAMAAQEVSEQSVETPQAAMADVVIETTTEIQEELAPAIKTEETTAAPVVAAPDYNKWIEAETGGMFKDVDSFKQALPKISEYESLAQQKADLEKNQITYANGFVKELNELAQAGASADQLKAFVKLNEAGELSDLNPLDAKVAKLVLVDGYSEVVARKKVDREYPLDDFDEGTDEREILEDELRVSSKSDFEALNKYKTQLTTVENPEKEIQEKNRLQQIADTEQHKNLVKQEAPKIANSIQGLGNVNLNGKEGDEAVMLDMPFAEEYKAKVHEMAENYFMLNNEPITQDGVNSFAMYAKANYLAENFDKIAKSIFTHAESVVTERIVNKYENRSGLAPQIEPQVDVNKQEQYQSFLERVANGK